MLRNMLHQHITYPTTPVNYLIIQQIPTHSIAEISIAETSRATTPHSAKHLVLT